MKNLYIAIVGLLGIYTQVGGYDLAEPYLPTKNWYFPLMLEKDVADKYKECIYYPESQRLSCALKNGKATKEKKNIYVQPGVKPHPVDEKQLGCAVSTKIYGYYVDKETNIKYWVWKFGVDKKKKVTR